METMWTLFRIEWKSVLRSPLWGRNLLVNLLLWLSFLYLVGLVVLAGVLMDDVLIKIPLDEISYRQYGPSFVIRRLNRFLLYYFFGDFVLRYFMQKLPALSVQPLLHLPVRRKWLANFMLIRSGFNAINLIHLLLFVPFIIEVFSNLPFSEAVGWSVGFIGSVITMNYVAIYLKRKAQIDARVYFTLLFVFVLLILLDWYGLLPVQAVSAAIFNAFFLYPPALLVPALLAVLCYALNFRFLLKNMYLDDLMDAGKAEVSYRGTSGLFSKFGLAGVLAELDLKLIWRNKRPRSAALASLLFLLFGVVVFPNPDLAGNGLTICLFALIITGMFILNYGQYLLGWEGGWFDHILTRNVSFYQYYLGKYLLFALVSTLFMLLSTPYVYFGWEILLALFCLYLYNLGINVHLVMFFGSWNPKKIDLTKSSMMNIQGTGMSQFLLAIPVLGLPIGIYFVGVLLYGELGGYLLLGVVGLLGLAFTRWLLKLLAKWLWVNRHEIAEDFRNQ
ncbi:MAG: DUF5687 family protein [Salibacteraceae bacterium]